MRRALPIIGLAAMLAACSNGQEAANNAVEANATVPAVEATPAGIYPQGWASLFDAGPGVVAAFGRMGLRPGPYQEDGDVSRSTSARATLVDTTAPTPNGTLVEAVGDAEKLERVAFILELTDPATAAPAKERFMASVGNALAQLGVPGSKAVEQPILKETPATGSVPGADWKVERTPMTAADTRKITVTFTRAGDKDPATSVPETQGK